MAHALRQAAPHIRGPFVLSACDNLVSDAHIGELMAGHAADPANHAMLSLMQVPRDAISQTGIVAWQSGTITCIVEKPAPADAPSDIASLPLYVLSPRILDYLPEISPSPRGEYELQDGVRGVLTDSRLTLTRAADLLEINLHYLRSGYQQLCEVLADVGMGSRLIPPVLIEAGTTIGSNCLIGPNVYIEHHCTVGDDVTIQDAVMLRNSLVCSGSTIVNQVAS
jgi:NDP-sugar pyrophosphorylase family protein